jgi:hypothetical protein
VHDGILRDHYERAPKPLPVPIKKGKLGRWVIDTFTLKDSDVRRNNLACYWSGQSFLICPPGTYTRLVRLQPEKAVDKHVIVMSNTPMEVRTNMAFIEAAKGRVLISGLGLGMALKAALDKPDVHYVKVLEIDNDLIELVGHAFERDLRNGRLMIEQADALSYQPGKDERYDVAWHDIWDTISDENLPQMAVLTRKWQHRVPLQLCWARDECRRMKRQTGRMLLPSFLF